MILKQIPIGPMENFAYILGCEETKEAAIVDPGWEHEKLLMIAEELGLEVTHLLITHSHYDHIQELPQTYEKTKATVVIGETDPYSTKHFDQVVRVKEGDEFKVGNLTFSCVFTPGHHPGETCYIHEQSMLTGDMLFVSGCGRVDLPGSNPDHMWESLVKLQGMEDDLVIYPGHDYGKTTTSTLAEEKKNNRFLKCKNKEEFFQQRGV